ncbi:hypothetical protein HHK36_015299 [Tetracentron sinense]|uniref:Pyrrolo-quinoline quinone repeat domain-containing protein n=1 Tax=Tetracentron sinense TaxID=13715 RepID=A0A834Z1Q9_TETSI|nr:hypothetical protein HHK36_015299 [Tetracentron sinense]
MSFTLALSQQNTNGWSMSGNGCENQQNTNGVLFAGFVVPHGPSHAMDVEPRKILWSYDTSATVCGGMLVSYGCIYLGNGYTMGLPNSSLLELLQLQSRLSALWRAYPREVVDKRSKLQLQMALFGIHNKHGHLVLLWVLFCLLAITASAHLDAMFQWLGRAQWLNHGGDLSNRRYAEGETKISPATVSNLRLKWEFFAGRDITATPAIFDGTLYFPSWNGYIYAVKAVDGSLVWKKNLEKLTGLKGTGLFLNVNVTVSRSTPTVADALLIIGIFGPAVVIAVKRKTGKLVWSTLLDNHNRSIVTMSGTAYNGGFYVGTSSVEEALSVEQCCTFRGSMSKLDIRSGAILWRIFTVPDNNGTRGEYAGGAIWGSSPAIDVTRNLVYIATGNLYSAPLRIRECQDMENNQTVPTHQDQCVEPDNHSDSMLAFDLDSGNITWYRQLGGYDVWFSACNNLSTSGCPPGPNPDADFGEAPMMLSIFVNGTKRDVVAAVQKSGFAWALDRDTGDIIWSTEAGPGGTLGGGTWGSATDGRRVYTNIVNSGQVNFTLAPSKKTTTAGAWVAMDACTGRIIWSTANPKNTTCNGPVTVANGVLFAGSVHRSGPIYAMDVKSGDILWSYDTGASVYGGMSVSEGCIYVGNGYKVRFGFVDPSYSAGTSLYAFCV